MRSLSAAGRVAEIDGRLDGLEAATPAVWGVMSAHQMVTHLRDAMAGCTNGVPMKAPASPMRNGVARYFVLSSGIQWPRNIPTVPQLDLRGKPKPATALFSGDLARLRVLLAEFAAMDMSRFSPEHPIFGPLTREQWMRWAYLHADHHLRQFGR